MRQSSIEPALVLRDAAFLAGMEVDREDENRPGRTQRELRARAVFASGLEGDRAALAADNLSSPTLLFNGVVTSCLSMTSSHDRTAWSL